MPAHRRNKIPFQGCYVAGGFEVVRESSGEWTGRCPGDFSDEVGRVTYAHSSIDRAVESARGAAKAWSKLPASARAEYLRKYQAALSRHEAELAEVIAREVGKPLWEARKEVAAMASKVDVTLGESVKLVADIELAAKPGADAVGRCRFRPQGVLAVIGPFAFPGHLPNGHLIPALATGNTVVFKPSEKAPFTGQLIATCFHEAGFPPGVFNLVQGERETGRRLCVHEGIDGILFTGSYEVGVRIRQDTLQQHWKVLALEMGGKNPAIVWKDADLGLALHETLVGAFVSAGQRCTSTSRVLVHEKVFDEFVSGFHAKSKGFKIGHPFDNPFMGPMIEQGAVDRYMKFQGIASREGAEIIMRGKALEMPGGLQGNYVTPSICVIGNPTLEAARKSVYQQTELFAPNVAILKIGDDPQKAVDLANATQYGMVCAVFTQDRGMFESMRDDLRFGLVNLNRSTVGASSRLPFGGLRKSGNFTPAALSSTLYCAHPVSSIESLSDHYELESVPGLNW